jgi:hypothetical protein
LELLDDYLIRNGKQVWLHIPQANPRHHEGRAPASWLIFEGMEEPLAFMLHFWNVRRSLRQLPPLPQDCVSEELLQSPILRYQFRCHGGNKHLIPWLLILIPLALLLLQKALQSPWHDFVWQAGLAWGMILFSIFYTFKYLLESPSMYVVGLSPHFWIIVESNNKITYFPYCYLGRAEEKAQGRFSFGDYSTSVQVEEKRSRYEVSWPVEQTEEILAYLEQRQGR